MYDQPQVRDSGTTTQPTIYTVSQLNRETKFLLEEHFPILWIEGELSNVSRPASGHLYFSLKDKFAQVQCAMFKNTNRFLNFTPKEGLHVLLKARVSLYEESGRYQLIAEYMEEAGDGLLKITFEALKKKLSEEGLFDPKVKKPIPSLPQCVGVITSPTGAAIKDILTTLRRRFPLLCTIIYPAAVQGKEAAKELVRALNIANQRKECDVLILARGGGSLEDLWPFNEEIVARAIFKSDIPVISGVGHEVDFTIADFVSDQRAATPTAAAEMISPNQLEILHTITQCKDKLTRCIKGFLQQKQQTVDYFEKRLIDPRQRLADQADRLHLLTKALAQCQLHYLKHQHNEIKHFLAAIIRFNPISRVEKFENQCTLLQQKLIYLMRSLIQKHQNDLSQSAATMDAYSPLATLGRGYAILANSQGDIIKTVTQVKPKDTILAQLTDGKLECSVIEVK